MGICENQMALVNVINPVITTAKHAKLELHGVAIAAT